MNENSIQDHDGESASLVQLWATPVGRCWLIRAGLRSAAAVGAAQLPVWSVRTSLAAPAQQAAGARPPSVPRTLQFALPVSRPALTEQPPSQAPAGGQNSATKPDGPVRGATTDAVTGPTLVGIRAAMSLVAHTATSRTALRATRVAPVLFSDRDDFAGASASSADGGIVEAPHEREFDGHRGGLQADRRRPSALWQREPLPGRM